MDAEKKLGLIVMTLITIIAVFAMGNSPKEESGILVMYFYACLAWIPIVLLLGTGKFREERLFNSLFGTEIVISVGGALMLPFVWQVMPWVTIGIIETVLIAVLYVLWKRKVICFHSEKVFLWKTKNREADRSGYPPCTYRYRCKRCGKVIEKF